MLVVARGHEREADLDATGDRTGAVPGLSEVTAQGTGEYVARREVQRSDLGTGSCCLDGTRVGRRETHAHERQEQGEGASTARLLRFMPGPF